MRAATLDARLEAIAGPPVVWVEAATRLVTHPPLDPHQGRTLYAVVDNLGGGYASVVHSGLVGGQTDRHFIRTHSTTETSWDSGVRPGDAASFRQLSGARVIGARQVLCSWLPDGLTALSLACGTAALTSTVANAAAGLVVDRLALGTPGASVAPVAAVLYGTAHDAVTRARVMAWLRHHYTAI